ncbi:uncharacterized protein LOC134357668 [Mobula hypostoma]|uniref:uncharacterized protein LOC134357668 n=1 Tax=Mobula hypostoma TaxID=723540 RepID=UPI002FC3050D
MANFTDQKQQYSKHRSQSDRARVPLPGTSSINKYGRGSKNAVCQSIYYQTRKCPHRTEQVRLTEENNKSKDEEECHITLFVKESLANAETSEAEILKIESPGSAVTDTACAHTVCGEKWLESRVNELNQSEVQTLVYTDTSSNTAFKSGDGKIVHSTERVRKSKGMGGEDGGVMQCAWLLRNDIVFVSRYRAQSGFDGDRREKHGGTSGVTSEMPASLLLLLCDRESPEGKAPNPRLCLLPGPGSKRSAEMVLGVGGLAGSSKFSDGLRVGLWSGASRVLHRQVCGAGSSWQGEFFFLLLSA